jgi:hypothetical protein
MKASNFVDVFLGISLRRESEPERHSVFNLETRNGQVVDREGQPFSVDEYSRFKHGDAVAQRRYGYLLADRFIEAHRELLETCPEKIAIAPFAYMNVPTAAGNTMPYFHERLGDFLRSIGKPCVERFHVYKYVSDHSKDHNYAKVSNEERKRILNAAPLSVDEKRLKGKIVIMVDDIFITGNSESRVHQVLREVGAEKIVFWYVARMDPEVAKADPGIESRLNQWQIKDLDDLAKIMVPGRYNFNLRNCKFVLEHSAEAISKLISGLDGELLRQLYATSLANSYYTEPKYVPGIDLIAKELESRGR